MIKTIFFLIFSYFILFYNSFMYISLYFPQEKKNINSFIFLFIFIKKNKSKWGKGKKKNKRKI